LGGRAPDCWRGLRPVRPNCSRFMAAILRPSFLRRSAGWAGQCSSDTDADSGPAGPGRFTFFPRSWVSKGIGRVPIYCVLDFTTGLSMDRHFGAAPDVHQVPRNSHSPPQKTVLKAVISEPLRDRVRLFLSRRREEKFHRVSRRQISFGPTYQTTQVGLRVRG